MDALISTKDGPARRTWAAIIFLALCLILTACGGGGTGRGTPTPEWDQTGSPGQGITPGAPPAAVTPATAGSLTLQVLSPQDGETVNAKEIQVRGVTSAGAVVSVNDDVLIAGADGNFESTVTLEEGPNLIEVIASNEAGDEVSVELAVTYEP